MNEEFYRDDICSLCWSAVTDPGRVRRDNEDAFLGLLLNALQIERLGQVGEASLLEGDYIFAVSDGMGGAKAGEFASRIAVERIARIMPAGFRLAAQGFRSQSIELLEQLLSEIHEEMVFMGHSYEECKGMGATLSLGWFTPEQFIFGHVGDTRIYHLPKIGGMIQATQDHTHVGWLLRQGKITEMQARFHPQKNQLQMALGGQIKQIIPQFGTVRYEPGDTFIFCSDGVTDGIGNRALEEMVRNPPQRVHNLTPAQAIVSEAKSNSRDNLTALVVKVVDPVNPKE